MWKKSELKNLKYVDTACVEYVRQNFYVYYHNMVTSQ